MFYVFRRRTHHAVIMAQRILLWATRSCQRSVQAFMEAINALTQAVNAFIQAVNAFMQYARSCSMSMCSCRLPVLSDLLVWFSTHCTDANRRETMPKQHYITCLAQCVPTLTLYSCSQLLACIYNLYCSSCSTPPSFFAVH